MAGKGKSLEDMHEAVYLMGPYVSLMGVRLGSVKERISSTSGRTFNDEFSITRRFGILFGGRISSK